MLTEDLCRKAVQGDWHVLSLVPEKLRTEAVCLGAFAEGWIHLDSLRLPCCTEAMAYAAVWDDGRNLAHVPVELVTPELCLDAVQENGCVLELVPEALRTPAVCLEAIRHAGELSGFDGQPFASVPPALQTQELALEDELVNDGHEPVVQDEGQGRIQDGPVRDVHGGTSAFVDLDPKKPGGQDGADNQEKPGALLLIERQVVLAHHARPV